jgi:hypothetical protein
LFIPGPAGRLESLLDAGEPAAEYCAVVAHPHPLYGGTMHNKVVYHIAKTLNAFGLPVLRFNFRGVGDSGGRHDNGCGEIDDVHAALDWVHNEFNLPVIFAGFSFGAAVGIRAACQNQETEAMIAVGAPVYVEERHYTYSPLRDCAKPKLFVSGDRDEFSTPGELEGVIRVASQPKKLVIVPGCDHFFTGHLDEMQSIVKQWVGETLHLECSPDRLPDHE